MTIRVIINCAASLDGYIDDCSPNRLILSNSEDLDRVDELRASVDAVLIGAETVRSDNPKILIKSEIRVHNRRLSGKTDHPIKVTLTQSGDLPENSNFFVLGNSEKLVYCCKTSYQKLSSRLSALATVVFAPDKNLSLQWLLNDLSSRGVRTVLVEGGGKLITSFLKEDLFDELFIAVAPRVVCEEEAPKLFQSQILKDNNKLGLKLASVSQIGDMALLRYLR